MPATLEREKKTARIDLRLTPTQRSLFESAAFTRNESLNQWATAHLEEAARQDIESHKVTYLSDEDFDALLRSLEKSSLPPELQALLQETPVWEK